MNEACMLALFNYDTSNTGTNNVGNVNICKMPHRYIKKDRMWSRLV